MEGRYAPSTEVKILIREYGSKRNNFFPTKPSPNFRKNSTQKLRDSEMKVYHIMMFQSI